MWRRRSGLPAPRRQRWAAQIPATEPGQDFAAFIQCRAPVARLDPRRLPGSLWRRPARIVGRWSTLTCAASGIEYAALLYELRKRSVRYLGFRKTRRVVVETSQWAQATIALRDICVGWARLPQVRMLAA